MSNVDRCWRFYSMRPQEEFRNFNFADRAIACKSFSGTKKRTQEIITSIKSGPLIFDLRTRDGAPCISSSVVHSE